MTLTDPAGLYVNVLGRDDQEDVHVGEPPAKGVALGSDVCHRQMGEGLVSVTWGAYDPMAQQ